jgi:hypothetical protein
MQEIRFLLLNSRNVILSRFPRCNSAIKKGASAYLPVRLVGSDIDVGRLAGGKLGS